MQQKISGQELLKRVERSMAKSNDHSRVASPTRLAQLAQRVNSRHNSGYSGSRREEQFCKAHGIRPTFAQRVK